jgi:hypothetical protein
MGSVVSCAGVATDGNILYVASASESTINMFDLADNLTLLGPFVVFSELFYLVRCPFPFYFPLFLFPGQFYFLFAFRFDFINIFVFFCGQRDGRANTNRSSCWCTRA